MTCPFCGTSAGLFKREHADCRARHEKNVSEFERIAVAAATCTEPLSAARPELERLSSANPVLGSRTRELIVHSWGRAIDQLLAGQGVSREQELGLVAYADAFNMTEAEKEEGGALMNLAKALTLRDVMQGILKPREHVTGPLPFLLQKGELLLWLFNGVKLYHVEKHTHYEGRTHGLSVRLFRGVYYRAGGFKGVPVTETGNVLVATGVLGVMQEALYFAGQGHAFRIPFKKIVGLVPYSDGLGVQRDGEQAKPMTFVLDDGWFAYNLITNLTQRF